MIVHLSVCTLVCLLAGSSQPINYMEKLEGIHNKHPSTRAHF